MSDENIGIVIGHLVKSDMSFDPDRHLKSSVAEVKPATIETYRFNGFIHALYKIRAMDRRVGSISLDHKLPHGESLYNYVSSNSVEPSEGIVGREVLQAQSSAVEELLSNENLTKTEQKYLRMIYVDGLSLLEVGEICGVTKQAVSYTELKALKKLRTLYAHGN